MMLYLEVGRMIKLLGGLRLDGRTVTSILSAAGNEYKFNKIVDVLRVHSPPRTRIAGQPLRTGSGAGSAKGKGKRRGHNMSWTAAASSPASPQDGNTNEPNAQNDDVSSEGDELPP